MAPEIAIQPAAAESRADARIGLDRIDTGENMDRVFKELGRRRVETRSV